MALNTNVCHKFNVIFDLDDAVIAIDEDCKIMEENDKNHNVKELMDKLAERDNKYELQKNMIQKLTGEKEILINDLNMSKEKNNDLNLEINKLENDNILYQKDLKELKQKYNEDINKMENINKSLVSQNDELIQANQRLRIDMNQLVKANDNKVQNQQKKNVKKKKRISYGCANFLGL
eukprot:541732_1